MNNTKIDYVTKSWNPVTGCLNQCPYCYARKIAERFGRRDMPFGNGLNVLTSKVSNDPYPFGFEPTFHRYRLDEPAQIKKPQNIFVCSMADLFGEWVPREWICDVFEACEAAPQHRYMFLTKNPQRYTQFYLPVLTNEWWFGASATNQKPIGVMEESFGRLNGMAKTFISIEPIHGPILIAHPGYFNWIIVGAETGSRKGKVIPKREWIDDILVACIRANVPIFMKESLRNIMGEDFIQMYPWPSIHGTV